MRMWNELFTNIKYPEPRRLYRAQPTANTAPVSALVAMAAYRASQPVVYRGGNGFITAARAANSSSLNRTWSE